MRVFGNEFFPFPQFVESFVCTKSQVDFID